MKFNYRDSVNAEMALTHQHFPVLYTIYKADLKIMPLSFFVRGGNAFLK